jgi:hypothetical protein
MEKMSKDELRNALIAKNIIVDDGTVNAMTIFLPMRRDRQNGALNTEKQLA